MLPYEAEELFQKYCPQSEEMEGVLRQLLDNIGRHTLTIELLAKNLSKLKRRGYTLLNLQDDLQKRGLLNPSQSRKVSTDYGGGREGRYEAIIESVCFDLNPLSEYEHWILLQFAVLPSVFITYSELSDWLKITEEKIDDFDEGLDNLISQGWLESGEAKSHYKLHPIIQAVVKKHISPTIENCAELIDSLAQKLEQESSQNLQNNLLYLTYAKTLAKYCEGKNANIATLYKNLGDIFQYVGELKEANNWIQKAIDIYEDTLPEKKEELAQSYNILSLTLYGMNELAEANSWIQKAIDIYNKNVSPKNHPHMALFYNNLAMILQAKGELHKAKKWIQKTIEIGENTLTKHDPNLAQSYNNLASILHALGEFDLARKWMEKAILSGKLSCPLTTLI